MTTQRTRRNRSCKLIIGCLAAVFVLLLALWRFVPRPLVSPQAEIASNGVIRVMRWGEEECYDLEENTAQTLLQLLGEYSAVPEPFRSYYPREMGKIPFELELSCMDGGKLKRIVLGADFFWYTSAASGRLYYRILDGQALMDEVTSLMGLAP